MSTTSFISPGVPVWSTTFTDSITLLDAGGNGFPQNFTSTSPVSVVTTAFVPPSAGRIVLSAAVNIRNTNSSTGAYSATLIDNVSSTATTHYLSLGAGNTTAQYGSMTPSLTMNVSQGQSLNFLLTLQASNGAGVPAPTYKWDWNVVFYPN